MSGFLSLVFRVRVIVFGLALALGLSTGFAQENSVVELLEERWFELETENFVIYSQGSSRETESFASDLETWRHIAADIVAGTTSFPKANVPNYIFLFDNARSFNHFQRSQEAAFFYQTPRANYMALTRGDDESLLEAKHYYAHFLVKNFFDLRLPRWFEEALAGYLSRVELRRGSPILNEYTREDNIRMAELGASLSMNRLLYRDDALASPRVIQIANLKAAALLYYLKHGHEQEYPDYRESLKAYVSHLLAGRTERFAFDMAFPVTTDQLDEELLDYLVNSDPDTDGIMSSVDLNLPEYEPVEVDDSTLATMLGELSLNSGSPEHAELFFRRLVEAEEASARSYSGLGDALRFQSLGGDAPTDDQTIATYFEQAIAAAPEDLHILLDYGEYWEAELSNCEKVFPENQRRLILNDIETHFSKAIALSPNSAETNLAMGQLYLFDGQDWQIGMAYQQRAFELLPADSFIMEQSIKYFIAAGEYQEAQRLIDEMAQPIHMFGEPAYVTALRKRLDSAQRNTPYDICAEEDE
jgi:tetratricopeptide (TPR) repeat protein